MNFRQSGRTGTTRMIRACSHTLPDSSGFKQRRDFAA